MPRTCVFCGASPTSNEHVWPAWAGRSFAPEGPSDYRHVQQRSGGPDIDRRWRDKAYSLKVNAVCLACNNGWMSRLESEARPILEPMMEGHGQQLRRTRQRTLARWALKTALMLEQAQSSSRRVFPEQEYAQLFHHQCPGPEIRVWLAAYDGALVGLGHIFGADGELAGDPERGTREIYGATISLGPVTLQVLGTTASGFTKGIGFGSDTRIQQIWPTVPKVSWSRRSALNDHELQSFADAMTAKIAQETAASDVA